MRSAILTSAFAVLALGNPIPQEIDLGTIDSLPPAAVSNAPVDISSQSVSVKPSAAATSVGAAKVTNTAVPSTVAKRNNIKRSSCEPQPLGAAPTSTPDTAEAFLADSQYTAISDVAATPQGYNLAFKNLQGSSQTTSYLGYKTLDSYDTVNCASYCDQQDGCIAFNIYMERDPTVDPGATCANPASTTNYKCVKWGVQIQAATATNVGQWRQDFHVVIAGSNGYNKNAAPAPADGYTGPVALGGAINAPLDPVTHTDTYMGYKFFSFDDVQTYANGVVACTAACTAQTKYNAEHPPPTGNPSVCNQFVVYVLSDENKPQGIYCSMYTEEWASVYATNVGQYRGSDYWSVSQAYTYTNASYAAKYEPICDVAGCPGGSYSGGNYGGYGYPSPAQPAKCKSKRGEKKIL
ncbi:hypothetical protein sscle_08g062810 [Sclerotinia sclerotiorum 1980 UF-70]|uniref:Apple domain-containing protein n=2 Tax=Sclerotinia sclerotiorum (strain ATCC 18683 / 1980 / Ss-1) TaxID=665079 RepID=A0A1D9Q999_SCLS1|nr:hypothetical protein sscle_08g062810 [Sclerotinia sclerotiorum 1980 UF-70]